MLNLWENIEKEHERLRIEETSSNTSIIRRIEFGRRVA